jgi:hypothetical protein
MLLSLYDRKLRRFFYSLFLAERFPVPGREGGGGGAQGQPVLLSHHPLNPRPVQGVQEVRFNQQVSSVKCSKCGSIIELNKGHHRNFKSSRILKGMGHEIQIFVQKWTVPVKNKKGITFIRDISAEFSEVLVASYWFPDKTLESYWSIVLAPIHLSKLL